MKNKEFAALGGFVGLCCGYKLHNQCYISLSFSQLSIVFYPTLWEGEGLMKIELLADSRVHYARIWFLVGDRVRTSHFT